MIKRLDLKDLAKRNEQSRRSKREGDTRMLKDEDPPVPDEEPIGSVWGVPVFGNRYITKAFTVPFSTGAFAWGDGPAGIPESDLPHRRTNEPVVGWRAWRLRKDADGEPVLMSAVMDAEWPGPVFRSHAKPTLSDMAGVHAFRRTWWNREYHATTVEGEVLLYGKVIVFERGIRAEHAMVRSLRVYPGGWEKKGPDDRSIIFSHYTQMLMHGSIVTSRPVKGATEWSTEGVSSVAENRALIESLSRRYDCEVSFMPRVTLEDVEASRHNVPTQREDWKSDFIAKPTEEQEKWILGSR